MSVARALRFLRRPPVLIALALLIGVVLGRGTRSPKPDTAPSHNHAADVTETAETVWTCSMHPQIQLPEPHCGDARYDLGQGCRNGQEARADERRTKRPTNQIDFMRAQNVADLRQPPGSDNKNERHQSHLSPQPASDALSNGRLSGEPILRVFVPVRPGHRRPQTVSTSGRCSTG